MRGRLFLGAVFLSLLTACATATRDDAFKAYNAQRYDVAFKGFASLAGQGDATSQLMLGYMYEYGQGTPIDMKLATYFIGQAAARGNVEAEAHMGDLEEWVYGDHAQAFAWDSKAAKSGDAMAQVNLYYLYEHGFGVEQDDTQAQVWLKKAAAQPVGSFATFSILAKAFINAQKFYPKSAVLSRSIGIVVIAFDYYGGGVAQNVAVEKSCGDPILDDAGERTVQLAVLPALPVEFDKSGIHHFVIAINFSLSN